MAMPTHLASPRNAIAYVDGTGKDDSSQGARSLSTQLGKLRAEVQESLREIRSVVEATSTRVEEVARQLRDEAQDREISFRKALSQRAKREEVITDVTSFSQKLELSLQATQNSTMEHMEAIVERTRALEERCARHERLLETQQGVAAGKSDEIIVATTSPSSQGNIIRNNERIQQLTYRCDAVKAKCEQTESTLGRLVKRFNTVMGDDEMTKDVIPIKVMADRVEFIQEALEQMSVHMLHERQEREHLGALMSKMAQQVSRPTTPRVIRQSSAVRNHSEDPPPRRIRIGLSSTAAACATAAAVNPPPHAPNVGTSSATAIGSPMTPHAPLAFQARSAAALSAATLAAPGGSVGVLVQGSPILKGRGSPAVPRPVASSPRPAPSLSISTTTLQTTAGQSPRLATRSSVPSYCCREVLAANGGAGAGGAILRTSSQPAMPGQTSPVVSGRAPYVHTYAVQPPLIPSTHRT